MFEESVPETHVWILDIVSGETVRHDLPGSAYGVTWNGDGSRYAVALAPTPLVDDSYTSLDVYIVDAASGEVENTIGSVGKLGHFEFSPDGERIAAFHGLGCDAFHVMRNLSPEVLEQTVGEGGDILVAFT